MKVALTKVRTSKVPIAKIRRDGGTQVRVSLNEETVCAYTEALQADDVFPPAAVFYDGITYFLADGFHRVEAHLRAGRSDIDCIVWEGGQRDAVLHAVGANAEHGLRRSNADKRRAVELLLADEEWSKKSDRWIADAARVSDKTVGAVRVDCGNPQLSQRESKDGKNRPARAPKPAQPTYPSIGEAAAACGVSVEGVRKATALVDSGREDLVHAVETGKMDLVEALDRASDTTVTIPAAQWAAVQKEIAALTKLCAKSTEARAKLRAALDDRGCRHMWNEKTVAKKIPAPVLDAVERLGKAAQS